MSWFPKIELPWLEDFHLSERAKNVITGRYGGAPIETFEQLLCMTPRDLGRRQNCGRVTIKEIEDELASMGLRLGDPEALRRRTIRGITVILRDLWKSKPAYPWYEFSL